MHFETKRYDPENGNVFLVTGYNHSVAAILGAIEYAQTTGLTVPDIDDIKVEVLAGPCYQRMLSVEFQSATPPTDEGWYPPHYDYLQYP